MRMPLLDTHVTVYLPLPCPCCSYGKAARPEDALRAFDRLLQAGLTPSAVTFNSLLAALARAGWAPAAASVMRRMQEEGNGAALQRQPFQLLLEAHVTAGDERGAMRVVREMEESGFEADRHTFLQLQRLQHRSSRALLTEGKVRQKRGDSLAATIETVQDSHSGDSRGSGDSNCSCKGLAGGRRRRHRRSWVRGHLGEGVVMTPASSAVTTSTVAVGMAVAAADAARAATTAVEVMDEAPMATLGAEGAVREITGITIDNGPGHVPSSSGPSNCDPQFGVSVPAALCPAGGHAAMALGEGGGGAGGQTQAAEERKGETAGDAMSPLGRLIDGSEGLWSCEAVTATLGQSHLGSSMPSASTSSTPLLQLRSLKSPQPTAAIPATTAGAPPPPHSATAAAAGNSGWHKTKPARLAEKPAAIPGAAPKGTTLLGGAVLQAKPRMVGRA